MRSMGSSALPRHAENSCCCVSAYVQYASSLFFMKYQPSFLLVLHLVALDTIQNGGRFHKVVHGNRAVLTSTAMRLYFVFSMSLSNLFVFE